MQATYGKQKYGFGWRYIYCNFPPDILKLVGLTPAEAKEMRRKDLNEKVRPVLEFLGFKFPKPYKVECFITKIENGASTEIGRRYISLRGNDVHDDEKARTFSLDKVLKHLFPKNNAEDPEHRNIRKAIWDAYHRRKDKKGTTQVISLETNAEAIMP